MKQLVCEMCGSTDMIKQEGVFACQNCGTKYSVEEARKMMVEIEGTVKIDNSSAIANYLSMAKNAFDANNNKETENYCNKVIEMDPNNYEAWFMKGQSVGWQSTLANIRIPETVNAFSYALEYCPEDLKEKLAKNCEESLLKLHRALLSLRLKHFKEWPSEGNLKDVKGDLNLILANSLKFLKKTGIYTKTMVIQIGEQLNSALIEAWAEAHKKYAEDSEGHPSDRAFKKFLDEGDNICEAYEVTLSLFGEDAGVPSALRVATNAMEGIDTYSNMEANKLMIVIYKNMVMCQEKMINSCSYTREYEDGRRYYSKSLALSDEGVKSRNHFINIYQGNIKTIEKANDRLIIKAREKYWQEHAAEKAELDTQLSSVNKRLEDAQQKIIEIQGEDGVLIKKLQEQRKNTVPSEAEKSACEEKIHKMEVEYQSLGLFKGKEKKALMEKTEAEKAVLRELENRVKKEKKELEAKIDAEINKIKEQVKPIYQEIAKLNKQKEEVEEAFSIDFN